MENLLGGSAIRRRSGRVVALGSTAVLAAAGTGPLVMLTSSVASANTALVVSTLADSGAGSLRQAMLDANSVSGVDTITFTSGLTGTIDVLSDLPDLSYGIDLQGPGASVITINGGWTEAGGETAGHTLFVLDGIDVAEGATTISGVTIIGGNGSSSGGAIGSFYGDADLTIADVVLSGNFASNDGGALFFYYSAGTVTIRDSVISNNVAGGGGGAFHFNGYGDSGLSLNLINVEITGNIAGDSGGGLYLEGTDTTIIDSTIDGNVSGEDGGGIRIENGSLTISNTTISGNEGVTGGGVSAEDLDNDLMILNSTISGNHSTSDSVPYLYYSYTFIKGGGGGIYLGNGTGAVLIQSTVTANSSDAMTDAVGGIQSFSDSPGANDLTLIGSIVAGNDGFDIGSLEGSGLVAVESEYSVLGAIDPLVTFVSDGGTQVGVSDPMLGLLANNGGVTKTHALLEGSPAIDAGPDPISVFEGNEFDQRGFGFARIMFGVADAGAFEMQDLPTPEPTTTTTTAPAAEPVVPAFTG